MRTSFRFLLYYFERIRETRTSAVAGVSSFGRCVSILKSSFAGFCQRTLTRWQKCMDALTCCISMLTSLSEGSKMEYICLMVCYFFKVERGMNGLHSKSVDNSWMSDTKDTPVLISDGVLDPCLIYKLKHVFIFYHRRKMDLMYGSNLYSLLGERLQLNTDSLTLIMYNCMFEVGVTSTSTGCPKVRNLS